jgi:hypothetical protein
MASNCLDNLGTQRAYLHNPQPPLREPYYFDNETYGWAMRDCAIGLISTLSGWCKTPLEFKGSATGRVWHFEGDFTDRAQLLFTTDQGHGRIELEVHETNWVKAEVFVGDELKLRAWLEECYEEKEFWPDGSDGVTPEDGNAPGRISKRGRWLQLKPAFFPGVPDNGTGYWDVEDTFD